MTEMGLFGRVILALLKNGVPIVFVYWLLNRPIVTEWFLKCKDFLQTKLGISVSAVKRYLAIVLSVGISIGLYSVLAALGLEQFPKDFQGWLDLIFTLGAINFTGTQVFQAKDLKFK